MNTIAIIPARGGSKRIPRKNVKLFCGKPMIAWSIEAAQMSGLFDRIVVSTDSSEVADVAVRHGAEVPFMRPPELADDHATTDDVILHALQWFVDRNQSVSSICCIYATAPFLRPEYLRKGFEMLTTEKANAAFSVTTFPFPIYRALRVNETGRLEMLWPEHLHTRSQDLPETYHDAGQFYWLDAAHYLHSKVLDSKGALPVVLPRSLVQDIDTPEDWIVAERMFSAISRDP